MGRHTKRERGGINRAALVGGAIAVAESTHPALAVADPLGVVEQCESGGNPTAHNPSSSAAGAWQILTSTWRAYGGQRYAPTADQAPITEQREIAERIYAAEGLAPWRPSQACWGGQLDDTPRTVTTSAPTHHTSAPQRHHLGMLPGADHYTVQPGDTLAAIAEQHGLTWRQLWNENHQLIENPNLIYPGLRLSLAGISSGVLGTGPHRAVS